MTKLSGAVMGVAVLIFCLDVFTNVRQATLRSTPWKDTVMNVAMDAAMDGAWVDGAVDVAKTATAPSLHPTLPVVCVCVRTYPKQVSSLRALVYNLIDAAVVVNSKGADSSFALNIDVFVFDSDRMSMNSTPTFIYEALQEKYISDAARLHNIRFHPVDLSGLDLVTEYGMWNVNDYGYAATQYVYDNFVVPTESPNHESWSLNNESQSLNNESQSLNNESQSLNNESQSLNNGGIRKIVGAPSRCDWVMFTNGTLLFLLLSHVNTPLTPMSALIPYSRRQPR
jgi:hypothetical protein